MLDFFSSYFAIFKSKTAGLIPERGQSLCSLLSMVLFLLFLSTPITADGKNGTDSLDYGSSAPEESGVMQKIRITDNAVDSIAHTDDSRGKSNILGSIARGIKRFIGEFNTCDTTYIEPQHYKFQAMLQMSSMFQQFTLYQDDGHKLSLSPDVNTRIGPYVGYSLIFLGYTLQLNNLYIGNNKKTFNLSLYTSLIGADIFINNNNKFKIKDIISADATSDIAEAMYNVEFGGFNVNYWGFNTYYIFNHRRHGYPAAYNQSTCQKRSAGSPLVGFGFGRYNMEMDWQQLDNLIAHHVPSYTPQFADGSYTESVKYDRYSLYGGYSYNWAFARNWMMGGSATLALSYNKGGSETFRLDNIFRDFKFDNLRVDGISRLAVVWNNTRLFAGLMAKVDSYTYSKARFKVNNINASINIYAGLNFGKKRQYRTNGRIFEF